MLHLFSTTRPRRLYSLSLLRLLSRVSRAMQRKRLKRATHCARVSAAVVVVVEYRPDAPDVLAFLESKLLYTAAVAQAELL